MVAINSLTYLLYSFLTLAANDQPTDQNPIDPDRRPYSEQYDPDRRPYSEQYVPDRRPYSEQYDPDRRPYSEQYGRPVQPFAQKFYLHTVDRKAHPAHCEPTACQQSCEGHRYPYGKCVGYDWKDCVCREYEAPVDDGESFEIEDPVVSRYGDEYTTESDDYTTVSYEEPKIMGSSHGCPNTDACRKYCQEHRGRKEGACVGMYRMECVCPK